MRMRWRNRSSCGRVGGVGRRWRWSGAVAASLLAVALATPAAAEPNGTVGAVFVGAPAPIFQGPASSLDDGLPLITEDCPARILLDCFVAETVQILGRNPTVDPWPAAETEPAPAAPVRPRVGATPPPADPTPPEPPAVAEEAAVPPPAPEPPPELADLRAAIEASGLGELISVGGGAEAGVLTIGLPTDAE